MGKFENFINTDPQGCEKLYGTYGCKYCKEDVEFAWWDANKAMFFWICPNNHRSEQKLN